MKAILVRAKVRTETHDKGFSMLKTTNNLRLSWVNALKLRKKITVTQRL